MPISNGLMNAVAVYIRKAFEDAQAKAKTKRIRDNLKMTDAHQTGEGSVGASIEVSLLSAPEAVAYEFGSGLHDPNGSHLIPIRAVRAKALSFWWEKAGKQFVGKELPYGHPGVASHPALGPAIKENIPFLMNEIKTYVKQEIGLIITENNARTGHDFS